MVTRRRFLKNTAVFGAILLSPMAYFRPLDRCGPAGLAAKFKQFRIFFEAEIMPAQGPSFLAGLGAFYRASEPEFQPSPPRGAGALAKAVADDFAADRLVIYKGWVFAESEARLMAELPAHRLT